MFNLKIVEKGCQAFHDGVQLYKNPYASARDISAWQRGWIDAEENHKLFISNQSLKETLKDNLKLFDNRQIVIDRNNETIEEFEKKIQSKKDQYMDLYYGLRILIQEEEDKGFFSSRKKLISNLKALLDEQKR